MKRILYYSLLIISSIVLNSCGNKDFFEYSRTGDVCRIPIIKPLEVTSYSDGNTWFLNLPFQTIKNYKIIDNVTLIGIKDSIISVYSQETYISQYSRMTQAWFIIEMNRKKEIVFDNEKEYKEELNKLSIDEIKLYDVKQVFNDFDLKKELPVEWNHNSIP